MCELCTQLDYHYIIHGGIMVRIANSDIPNLSKIVEDAFDSIGDFYHGDIIEFDDVDTGVDISMNTDLDSYIPDMSDVSNDE